MKRSHLIAALLSTLAMGFFVGRVSSAGAGGDESGKGGADGKASKLRTRVGERPATERPDTLNARLRQDIRSMPTNRIPDLVFRALETGDPILRRQFMSDLYARMDLSNYQEMMDQILEVSNATAREYPDEFLLMSMRAGQIAGRSVMEDWKKKDIGSEAASKSFTGWAHVDPAAAQAWLESQSDLNPKERNKLLNSLITGAMVFDPAKATQMLSSMPEADRDLCMSTFTNQIVQTAGKDAGVEWLSSLRNGDPQFAQRAATSIFDRILWSGANRLNASAMTKDLEVLSSVVEIDENWIVRSMGQIRDRKPIGGIELLDQIARNPTLKDVPLTDRAWNSAVKFALERNRAAVSTWLQDNTDSPIYERVAQMSGQAQPADSQ